MATLRETSKGEFIREDCRVVETAAINTGCLQRIADAVEKMAIRYTELIDELADYEWRFEAENREVRRWANRCAAYKGIIRKMKGGK